MIGEHTSIDWDKIHARLAAGEQAMEAALNPGEAAIRTELERRAVQLAKPRQSADGGAADSMELLVFGVCGGKFAVELVDVEEVGPMRQCTAVPGAAAEVCGVIHHRGEVRCVIDLSRRLGLVRDDEGNEGYFVHVKTAQGDVLFRVDEVDSVMNISAAELATAEEEEHKSLGDMVRGIHPQGIVVLRADVLSETNDSNESEASHAHISR